MSSGFPTDFLRLSLSVCSILFSEPVPTNDLLLQLQLQSAGSLHVAFRNLHYHKIEAEQSEDIRGKTRGHH